MLNKYQARCPNHFIVKTLASIKVLESRDKITAFVDKSKHCLIFDIMATVEKEQLVYNDSPHLRVLEVEEEEHN